MSVQEHAEQNCYWNSKVTSEKKTLKMFSQLEAYKLRFLVKLHFSYISWLPDLMGGRKAQIDNNKLTDENQAKYEVHLETSTLGVKKGSNPHQSCQTGG